MFTNQGINDQGCGKWLTTKNTRRRARSLKQKNARGAMKGRKKPSVFKNDHVPGVVMSSTPMSPRLVEMLSRVKQAKVERFFKPVDAEDQEDKMLESGEVSRGFNKEQMLQSYRTPILRRQHKMNSDQEDFPVWNVDLSSSERHQNEMGKLNISGILPIEVSHSSSSTDTDTDNLVQGLQLPSTPEPNLHIPSPNETIRSPVSKRLKSMTVESPTSPPCSFYSSSNDERDSDSFHYTQWVNAQKIKSKELQGNNRNVTSPDSSQTGTKLPISSGESSTNLNRKYSQGIHDGISSDTESQFRFSEWAFEQKLKCKKLQDTESYLFKTQNLHNKLEESIIPNYLQPECDWADSNRHKQTDWVRKQKRKNKLQQSFPESKKVPQKYNYGLVAESLEENDSCLSESEIYEAIEKNIDSMDMKSQAITHRNAEVLRSDDKNPSSRQAFKDVSNGIMCNNGTSSKIERKIQSELTSSFQESEPFQYTEWTRIQKHICKTIQKKPEIPSFQDDFWDIPLTEKKVAKPRNESQAEDRQPTVLASDTDQESDSEMFAPFD